MEKAQTKYLYYMLLTFYIVEHHFTGQVWKTSVWLTWLSSCVGER